MHCFRDASSLHQFLSSCPSTELHQLIREQLETLADFDGVPLGDLVTIVILAAGDSASTIDLPLSRKLTESPIESCFSHSEWFELTIVVSDAGFGYVVFIPKNITDQSLLDFCVSQSARTLEAGS